MNNNEFCSLKNVTRFIQRNKENGLKNYEIIKQLIKKGCCFQIVFDAMDKTTKKTR